MGPRDTVTGSEFAGMFDLFESFDDIPTEGLPGDEDDESTIWVVGSMPGYWKGDLRQRSSCGHKTRIGTSHPTGIFRSGLES